MTTPRGKFPSIAALIASTLLTGLIAWAGEEASPWSRVRSMTREHREALVANLARFDDLPRDQKEAIRELDARLESLEPEVRNRYLAILRRYHTLYQALPKDRRRDLDKLSDPNDKLKALLKFQEERVKAFAAQDAKYADDLQWSSLTPRRLHQTARELIVWFKLDQPEDAKVKAEYVRTKDPVKRRTLMEGAIKNRKDVMQELRHEFGAFLTVKELFTMQEAFRAQEPKFKAEIERRLVKEVAKPDEKKKAVDPQKLAAKYMDQERDTFHRAWVEKHMRDLEPQAMKAHDSLKVDPADQARFEAALPPWAWESMDLLPPDAARRRLKVLYRLVFPSGKEMPKAQSKAAAEAAKDKPKTPPPPAPGPARQF